MSFSRSRSASSALLENPNMIKSSSKTCFEFPWTSILPYPLQQSQMTSSRLYDMSIHSRNVFFCHFITFRWPPLAAEAQTLSVDEFPYLRTPELYPSGFSVAHYFSVYKPPSPIREAAIRNHEQDLGRKQEGRKETDV